MPFTPRLSSAGMQGNAWWYSSGNRLYAAGYGLPNCTCYAYGRYAEIRGAFAPLPTRNAGYWYDLATRFQRGSTPALGSIICYYDPKGKYAGHVAVVEVIHPNGDITTSNSAWRGTYFWTERVTRASGYRANWAKRKGYVVKGFIYNDEYEPDDPENPEIPEDPVPPAPSGKDNDKMPLWLMCEWWW